MLDPHTENEYNYKKWQKDKNDQMNGQADI